MLVLLHVTYKLTRVKRTDDCMAGHDRGTDNQIEEGYTWTDESRWRFRARLA
jgi:hypothetical protein